MKRILITLSAPFLLLGCDSLGEFAQAASEGLPLTEAEVSSGLKEALRVGIRNSVAQTSAEDGYLNNNLIRIPFPPEAQKVKTTLDDLGMSSLTNQFVESMNRAASLASEKATDIFITAISQMTITDAMDILYGADDAATEYLRRITSNQLIAEFEPIVQQSLDEVQVTQYWGDITSTYNQIPFVKPVETNLKQYVTNRALDGLFLMVAQEEKKIRENPEARVTELLKRVFGHPPPGETGNG